MPDTSRGSYPDPREEDIMAGERRLSRPDASLPDWEMPDTAYRPVPIVWFTAAMLSAIVGWCVAIASTSVLPAAAAAIMAGLLTGVIGAWTWRRGMATASLGWRMATVAMLVLCFAGAIAVLTAAP